MMIFRPLWSSIALLTLLATGGAAVAQGTRSPAASPAASPIASISPSAPNGGSNTWLAERYAESVPIADLLNNPQRWEGRFIRTTGRLRADDRGAVACTRMACAMSPNSRVGDRLECNRCSGPAILQAGDRALPLGNLRCGGVEILTYGVGGRIDRSIRWDNAQFEANTLSLGNTYTVAGILRRRPPGTPVEQPEFTFEPQSIVPGASSGASPIRGLW